VHGPVHLQRRRGQEGLGEDLASNEFGPGVVRVLGRLGRRLLLGFLVAPLVARRAVVVVPVLRVTMQRAMYLWLEVRSLLVVPALAVSGHLLLELAQGLFKPVAQLFLEPVLLLDTSVLLSLLAMEALGQFDAGRLGVPGHLALTFLEPADLLIVHLLHLLPHARVGLFDLVDVGSAAGTRSAGGAGGVPRARERVGVAGALIGPSGLLALSIQALPIDTLPFQPVTHRLELGALTLLLELLGPLSLVSPVSFGLFSICLGLPVPCGLFSIRLGSTVSVGLVLCSLGGIILLLAEPISVRSDAVWRALVVVRHDALPRSETPPIAGRPVSVYTSRHGRGKGSVRSTP